MAQIINLANNTQAYTGDMGFDAEANQVLVYDGANWTAVDSSPGYDEIILEQNQIIEDHREDVIKFLKEKFPEDFI